MRISMWQVCYFVATPVAMYFIGDIQEAFCVVVLLHSNFEKPAFPISIQGSLVK